jgi:transcriptional regulator with XRE-family HTH domain
MMGMSQTELGERLGVTFQQVQKYENGNNRISGSRIQQAANALQVPVSYFFDDSPQAGKHGHDIAIDFLSTPYGARISKAFPRIKDQKLQLHIVGLIEHVAGGSSSP